MRVRELLDLIDSNSRLLLPLTWTEVKSRRQVHKLDVVRSAVIELAKVDGPLGEKAAQALDLPILKDLFSGPVLMSPEEFSILDNLLGELAYHSTVVVEVLEMSMPKQDPASITLELPEGENFKQTVERLQTLEHILSRVGVNQPVALKIQNVDNGSVIFEVIGDIAKAAGPSSFPVIVLLLWHVASQVPKWMKELIEALALMKATNIALKELEAESEFNDFVRERARQKLLEAGPFSAEEATKLTQLSMELSKQLIAGVKILPAANAPVDVKVLSRSDAPMLPAGIAKGLLPSATQEDDPKA